MRHTAATGKLNADLSAILPAVKSIPDRYFVRTGGRARAAVAKWLAAAEREASSPFGAGTFREVFQLFFQRVRAKFSQQNPWPQRE